MHAMTLRVDDKLARKLEKYCKKRGYSKTSLITSLIKKTVEEKPLDEKTVRPPYRKSITGMESIVGIVSLGGDSVEDADNFCE